MRSSSSSEQPQTRSLSTGEWTDMTRRPFSLMAMSKKSIRSSERRLPTRRARRTSAPGRISWFNKQVGDTPARAADFRVADGKDGPTIDLTITGGAGHRQEVPGHLPDQGRHAGNLRRRPQRRPAADPVHVEGGRGQRQGGVGMHTREGQVGPRREELRGRGAFAAEARAGYNSLTNVARPNPKRAAP
ncbi:MAG TPA: hypothetical protein VFA26_06045 [Gemmataceae bacterium]|nr:hypothetical protein [Gemmataceae bacterium]